MDDTAAHRGERRSGLFEIVGDGAAHSARDRCIEKPETGPSCSLGGNPARGGLGKPDPSCPPLRGHRRRR
jgi:hypothetical protein